VGANGRTGPVESVWSEKVRVLRPVASVWSGGVDLVCGMKCGIESDTLVKNEVIRWKQSRLFRALEIRGC
jgi:hypothetical protein